MTSQVQDEIDALNASITKQGAEVRTLKKEGGSADSIAEAVAKLQALKIEHTEKSKLLAPTEVFNRRFFDDLILRKMFVVGAFEIHGGVKGLYDLGPPACALKVRTSCQSFPPSW
jgi:glycyl-tRNA synthetase